MDIKEIQILLQNLLNSKVEVTKINSYGEVSQIYLAVADEQKYILKLNNPECFEDYLKEKWFADSCLKAGITTPKVIFVGQTDTASYLLLQYSEGVNCFDIKNEEQKNEIFKNLGELAGKISRVVPAENISDLKTPKDARRWFYEDYINYELIQTQSSMDYLELKPEQREKVIGSLNTLKETEFEFCLCHGDLSLKNCLFDENKNKLILLDFGSAETQPKFFFEIMLKWLELKYEKTISNDNFLNFAHGLLGEDYLNWTHVNKKIIESLALVYVLDKYRWAHDRGTKDWQDEYLRRLRYVLNLLG